MVISTRRFSCRPLAVPLSVIGHDSPIPMVISRTSITPLFSRYAATEFARRSERALVIGLASRAVGVACDFYNGLVEFIQNLGHRCQHSIKLRAFRSDEFGRETSRCPAC